MSQIHPDLDIKQHRESTNMVNEFAIRARMRHTKYEDRVSIVFLLCLNPTRNLMQKLLLLPTDVPEGTSKTVKIFLSSIFYYSQ